MHPVLETFPKLRGIGPVRLTASSDTKSIVRSAFLVRLSTRLVSDPARVDRGGLKYSDLSPLAEEDVHGEHEHLVRCEPRGFGTVVVKGQERVSCRALLYASTRCHTLKKRFREIFDSISYVIHNIDI